MREIAPSVYVSTEYDYVNVGCVIGPEGVVAIDAPTLPRDALDWRERIAELTDAPIVYTALTDAHPHRMLCAALLEAPIVAAHGAYDQAADYSRGFWRNVVRRLRRNDPDQGEILRTVEPELPSLLFRDTLTLHKAGRDVRLEMTDGAAPGSSLVKLTDADIMFLGDTLVAGLPPVMDDCPDTKAWLQTLTALRRPYLADTLFIPGRGPLTDQSATEPLSEYIRLARRRVRSLHRAERPRDDVVDHVDELLDVFELPDDARSGYRRRVRNGLKQVYDELAPAEDSG
jgi:glyoxylase-like metal-dependent hydrolase (beta-lactamase superfamily II)